MDLIRECGDKDSAVILKTDQEPAIKFLACDVLMARTWAKTLVEMAPVGSTGSNREQYKLPSSISARSSRS